MKCQRCNRSEDKLIDSVFNTQKICYSCYIAEENHPKFHEAKDIQNDEILNKKNYSFKGIGVPSDIAKYYNDLSTTRLTL